MYFVFFKLCILYVVFEKHYENIFHSTGGDLILYDIHVTRITGSLSSSFVWIETLNTVILLQLHERLMLSCCL